MVSVSMNEYSLKGFRKSKSKNKKYDALLVNKKTGRSKTIPFGDKRYQHYKDSTGLGLYSNLNHGDKERRKKYKQRHQGFIKQGQYSAAYFSMRYLW